MALLEVPMSVALFPAFVNPVMARPFVYPTTTNPHVTMAFPIPIARRPNETRSCCGDHFHASLRRCAVDIHEGTRAADSWGHAGRNTQRCTKHCNLHFHIVSPWSIPLTRDKRTVAHPCKGKGTNPKMNCGERGPANLPESASEATTSDPCCRQVLTASRFARMHIFFGNDR